MLLLLMACLHKGPAAARVDPEVPPVLPSPEGELYTAGRGTPRDPGVANAARSLPWEEALSGAAGALAVATDRAPEIGAARWAAYRSGYPYPIRSLVFGAVAPGAPPDELMASVQLQLKPGDDLGLARARIGDEDRWVALIGHASRVVTPFPRQVARGASLKLGGDGLTQYRLVSPTGRRTDGALPASPTLEEAGEWWVELFADDGRIVVAVPVTCALEPAPAPPLDLPGRGVDGPEDATQQLLRDLGQIREIFDLRPVVPDDTLELVARQPLADALAGRWDAETATERVKKSGFADGAALTCQGTTVELCLDELLRSGVGRQGLLDPRWRRVGSGVQVDTRGVRLVIMLGTE